MRATPFDLGWLLPILIDSSIKGVACIAFAAAAVVALRRDSAASRHQVWLLALSGTLALPFLSLILPSWQTHLPFPPIKVGFASPQAGIVETPESQSVTQVADLQSNRSFDRFVTELAAPAPQESFLMAEERRSQTHARDRIPWTTLVACAWALGVIVAMVPLCLGLLSLERLKRSSALVPDARVRFLAKELTDRMGLKRAVRLLQNQRRSMPMTWGVLRPIILLPQDADFWSEERLQVAILHELAHVKRWDYLSGLLARVACAVYWFNPLVWLAASRLRAEQEQAADDLVLECSLEPAKYAEHLLAIASGNPMKSLDLVPALPMARRSSIERRLLSILAPNACRRPLSALRAGFAVGVAVCFVVPLASVSTSSASAKAIPAELTLGAFEDDPSARPADQAEALAQVRKQYIKEPDETQLRTGAIKGMIEALHDPYSEYLEPQKLEVLERQTAGRLTGIGVQLELKDRRVLVVRALPLSPAEKAGLKPGDVILEVDGKAMPTEASALPEVVRRIIGPAGSAVRLVVQHRAGNRTDLEITRAEFKLETVTGYRRMENRDWEFLLEQEHKIGYVQLSQLGADTPAALAGAVQALKAQGMRGLILDLRFCPGGLLNSAVDCVKLFVSEGKIVSVRGRDNEEKSFSADGKTTLGDFPLVVLVGEQTASASEIVAGALQDNKRALLLGSRTFGKGSVQSIIKLADGTGALKLTTAYYYLPSGRNIDRTAGQPTWGIDPTEGYYVPLSRDQLAALDRKRQERQLGTAPGETAKVTPKSIEGEGSDPQLAAGLKTLLTKLATGEYEKVGLALTAPEIDARRFEELQKNRDSVKTELDKIDQELDRLKRAKETKSGN
jgi:carboxyl-terminal processing protease